MARNLRKDDTIFLVGAVNQTISSNKLPSYRQILSVLYFHLKSENVRKSANLVADVVLEVWAKARIPTQNKDKCVKKIVNVYNELCNLKKSKNRNSDTDVLNRENFVSRLDNLFDIAHDDALSIMTIEEDKKFLQKQREPGRPGCMLGVDRVLTGVEKRKVERMEKQELFKKKHLEELSQMSEYSILSFPEN
jgi:hypothetical protein